MIRKSLLCVSIGVAVILGVTGAQAARPLRILPVGDSITCGVCGTRDGYRGPLYDMMTNAGYNVQYQGILIDNSNASYPNFHHAGYSGCGVAQIQNVMPSIFAQIDGPDLILLLIGTNDQGSSTDLSNLEALIGYMETNRPLARIIVSNLTPRFDQYAGNRVANFNAAIPGIVARQQALGYMVYSNDMWSSITAADLSDTLHPNDTGYAKMATNWFAAIQQDWGDCNFNPDIAMVSNGGGASGVTSNSATLNGQLISTGNAVTVVSVFWGATDCGTSSVAWDHFQNFGQCATGMLSANVTGLSVDTTYYYRFYASNSNGAMWAGITNGTFITGNVWVEASQPNASKDVSLQGVFTFHRPVTTTNVALTVCFTTSGTASSGVDFQPLTNKVTFPAGASSVDLAVVPLSMAWGTSNTMLILTMSSNLNYIASPAPSNSATVTVIHNDVPKTGPFKMKISFNGYNRAETLTNFPALVVFSNGMGGTDFDFRRYPFLTAGGCDMRFYDSTETTELPYEIEQWTNASSASAYVWVQAPQIAASTSYIWAKWGNPANASQMPYTTNGATWGSSYRGVWHLKETTGHQRDSTSNRFDSTFESVTAEGTVSGMIAGADQFNNTNDYVNLPALNLNTNRVTIMTWVNGYPIQDGDYGGIVISRGGNTTAGILAYQNQLHYMWNGGAYDWNSGLIIPSNQWALLTLVMDTTSATLYLNAQSAMNPSANSLEEFDGTTTLGADPVNVPGRRWIGIMDEVRIETVPRSSNWVWACWMNAGSNSSFNSYGTVSASAAATTLNGIPYSWLTNHGITNTSDSVETACLNGNGLNILQDYVAGLDPTNHNSYFSVIITNSAGQIVVCVPSIQPGGADYSGKTRYYDIEQCTNLLAGGSWQPALGYSGILAGGGIIACTNATPDSTKFYRARVRLQ